jgi:hypothetical protein
MKKFLFVAIALSLFVPSVALAHPGHEHKLMGTISSIDKNKIVIKTTEGKDATFEVTPTTTYKHGTEKGALSELKAGMRVVANMTEKDETKAKDVQYSAPATTAKK